MDMMTQAQHIYISRRVYTTKYNAQHEYVHATILRLLRRSACIIGIRDDQRWSEMIRDDQSVSMCKSVFGFCLSEPTKSKEKFAGHIHDHEPHS